MVSIRLLVTRLVWVVERPSLFYGLLIGPVLLRLCFPESIVSGYSSRRVVDDLSYYDDKPHIIVEDKYHVEPTRAITYGRPPSPPPPSAGPQLGGPHSASLQLHSNERY